MFALGARQFALLFDLHHHTVAQLKSKACWAQGSFINAVITYIACPCGPTIHFFIFLCPKIESKQYPWKKPYTLNYTNSIQEISAMCGKKNRVLQVSMKKNQTPWTILIVSKKCSKKIQTPWTIRLVKNRIVRGVWIFSWILAKFVKSVNNYYTFDKFKHLELSDSILGHSQIFSDTI